MTEGHALPVWHTQPVRLQRGAPVAGVDPEVARSLAKACHDRWSDAEVLAEAVHLPADVVAPLLDQLVEGGFLHRRLLASPDAPAPEWNTTLAGGALTMASFRKPIQRSKAQVLLNGVVERARAYNADDARPYLILELRTFGSYLRPDVAELGDLDLTATFDSRRPGSAEPAVLLAYARASGRSFRTFIASLSWPQEELLRTLRGGSPYVNVHTEDVSSFTAETQVVFQHEAPGARPL
jgi:hypothetical protein